MKPNPRASFSEPAAQLAGRHTKRPLRFGAFDAWLQQHRKQLPEEPTIEDVQTWRRAFMAGAAKANPMQVHNPATGRLQPVALITDRAKRYRAQAAAANMDRTHCVYCGATNPRDLDHINGRENDGDPSNLVPACRPCNAAKGAHFARIGKGQLTRQYNPTKAGGAATIGEWIAAVGSIIPHKGRQYAGRNYGLPATMDTAAAVALIRATPLEKRSEFGRRLARKHRGGSSQEVPF